MTRGANIRHEDGARVFAVSVPVRFADCDPAGIVFFPNYFRMLNSVVEDWLADLGLPWTELVVTRRIGTPTAHLDTQFERPASFGETLRFGLSVARLGNASLTLGHVVEGEGGVCMRARQVLVATTLDTHRPTAWPEDLRSAITRFKEIS